jgi:uncharacterized membrane protein YfcA
LTEITQILLITFVAFVATLMSAMCGAGSSLITTPVWLALGYPLPVAIASNTVSGSFWTLVAARNFLRGHEIDWQLIGGLVICGMLGAFFGTRVIVSCDPKVLQQLIGVLIISLVAFSLLRKNFGVDTKAPSTNRLFTSLAAFPLGFYEAFYGSGNSLFTSALLTKTRGFKFLKARGYSCVLGFFWCTFAAAIYLQGGKWNITLMLPAIIGSAFGASIGSKIGAKKGEGFARALFIIIGTILGMKLLMRI